MKFHFSHAIIYCLNINYTLLFFIFFVIEKDSVELFISCNIRTKATKSDLYTYWHYSQICIKSMPLSKIKFRTLRCFSVLLHWDLLHTSTCSLSVSQSAQFTTDTQTMTRGQWGVTEGLGGTSGRWMLWPSDRRSWWSPGSWAWQWSVQRSFSSP